MRLPLLALLVLLPLISAQARQLTSGVYREYVIDTRVGQKWRVTDPGVEREDARQFLPNPVFTFQHVNLDGATRAELTMHHWAGHSGTIGQQVIINDRHHLDIPVNPNLQYLPYEPSQYLNDSNPVFDIPLDWLHNGDNTIQGTIAKELQGEHWWGQWGWYWVGLRIWCDEGALNLPNARILADSADKTIRGDTVTIHLHSPGEEQIADVEFFARYHGYDEDGDNIFNDWHGFNVVSDHAEGSLGTDTSAPFSTTWDTSWIPDQEPGAISFTAIIRCGENEYRVLEPVQGYSIARDYTVQMFTAENYPIHLVRNQTHASSLIELPQDLNDPSSARIIIRTWNGRNHEAGSTPFRFNRGEYHPGIVTGANHFYSLDEELIDPAWLSPGENQLFLFSETHHHGCEVLVPGPAILLRWQNQ